MYYSCKCTHAYVFTAGQPNIKNKYSRLTYTNKTNQFSKTARSIVATRSSVLNPEYKCSLIFDSRFSARCINTA